MKYILLETDQSGYVISIAGNRGLLTFSDHTTGLNLMFFETKRQAIAYHHKMFDGLLNLELCDRSEVLSNELDQSLRDIGLID